MRRGLWRARSARPGRVRDDGWSRAPGPHRLQDPALVATTVHSAGVCQMPGCAPATVSAWRSRRRRHRTPIPFRSPLRVPPPHLPCAASAGRRGVLGGGEVGLHLVGADRPVDEGGGQSPLHVLAVGTGADRRHLGALRRRRRPGVGSWPCPGRRWPCGSPFARARQAWLLRGRALEGQPSSFLRILTPPNSEASGSTFRHPQKWRSRLMNRHYSLQQSDLAFHAPHCGLFDGSTCLWWTCGFARGKIAVDD